MWLVVFGYPTQRGYWSCEIKAPTEAEARRLAIQEQMYAGGRQLRITSVKALMGVA